MNEQLQAAMQIIREACALVNASLADHQKIQGALRQVEMAVAEQTTAKEKDKQKGTT